MHRKGHIQSIGVSNFDLKDMKELMAVAEIKPQILQGDLWSFVFDAPLMAYLNEHDIHFQVPICPF